MKNDRLASQKPWIQRHAATLVAVVAVVCYASFIQWFWGWAKIAALWADVGLGAASAAIALLLSTYVLRTWRIYDYFPSETAGSFSRLFRVVQVHNLLNVMLPFRSGEVSFPLLMKQEFGISITRATAALAVMRLLDLHALLAAAGVGLVLEKGNSWAWGGWALFALCPAIAFALKNKLLRVVQNVSSAKLQRFITELELGLPANFASFGRAWCATLVNWFVKVAVMAWVLILLGDIGIAVGFGGGLGGELSSVLPFHAPGGVGTYPAGITAGALAFGAGRSEEALALLGKAAVNAHLLIVLSSVVGALIATAIAGRAKPPR